MCPMDSLQLVWQEVYHIFGLLLLLFGKVGIFCISIDRLLFGLVSKFLRECSPAMIVRQLLLSARLTLRVVLPLPARLTLRVGTRDGPTLSTSDNGRKETGYQS